jgi:adenylate cyclase
MVDVLVAHDATIDKFIGDCITAVFEEQESGAIKSVKAALEMLRVLPELHQEVGVELEVRIGVNSGAVITGDLGSRLHRRDFTVIEDAVNVASRIESMAEPGQLLISAETESLLGGQFNCKSLGEVEVKGRVEPVSVYQC